MFLYKKSYGSTQECQKYITEFYSKFGDTNIFSLFSKVKDKISWRTQSLVTNNSVDFFGILPGRTSSEWLFKVMFVYSNESVTILIQTKTNSLKYEIPTVDCVNGFASTVFGIKEDVKTFITAFENTLQPIGSHKNGFFFKYERLTKKQSYTSKPKEVSVYLIHISKNPTIKKTDKAFEVIVEEKSIIDDIVENEYGTSDNMDFNSAVARFEETVKSLKENNFVDKSHFSYIPKGANENNWNFNLNRLRTSSNNLSNSVTSQNYSSYYSGELPDSIVNFVGSPSVDTSKISSYFGGVNKAVSSVNQFNSALLKNIAVILDSSDSGSYGVFIPQLNKDIKTKALSKMLEQKGYEIKDEQWSLVAYPKNEDKTKDQVQGDIDNLYSYLGGDKGNAININMKKILTEARQESIAMNSPYAGLFELLATLHLGETIVHEAVHAQGNQGEGPSEMAEESFVNWALPKINSEYKTALESMGKGDLFSPIIMSKNKRQAKREDWYKVAQRFPFDVGDLKKNRPASNNGGSSSLPDWAKQFRNPAADNIESKLGRQFMSPLPQDLSQENDITELQLRKINRNNHKIDENVIYEELLSSYHAPSDIPYKSIEELMDEKRPKPLLKTIKSLKTASIIKTATLFGWMNNLQISDGSTIPGLSDRVMAWEDRDESFSDEEKTIREQPRYNPEYDADGFYYKFIEPRWQPTRWDSQDNNNVTQTSPARRFASTNYSHDFVMSVINQAKQRILDNVIHATRFILTEDIAKDINGIVGDNHVDVAMYNIDSINGEDIFAFWIFDNSIKEEDIENVEKAISDGNMEDIKDSLKKILSINKDCIDEIVSVAEKICKSHSLNGMSIVGSFARAKMIDGDLSDIDSLSFNGGSLMDNANFGFLLAQKLGVKDINYNKSKTIMHYRHKCTEIIIYLGFQPKDIINMMKVNGINTEDPLMVDLCNRDFTVNMLSYNIVSKKIECPFFNVKFDEKKLSTLFDSETIVKNNPILALRAIYLKIKYDMSIDEELEIAIIKFGPMMFKKCRNEDIIACRNNIKFIDSEKANREFEDYGLERVNEI